MTILSDPQVSCQSRWKSMGTKQKIKKCNHSFGLVAFQRGAHFLSNKEVMNLVTSRNILNYKLEAVLETPERGVAIRREMLSPKLPVQSALAFLPYKDYDYAKVLATCISVQCVVLFIVKNDSCHLGWCQCCVIYKHIHFLSFFND